MSPQTPLSNNPTESGFPSRPAGFLFVLGAALSWSLAGIGIKSVPLSGLAIVGFRSLFALPIFMWVLRLRAGSLTGKVLWMGVRRRAVWIGAADYAFTMLSFVLAAKQTTAANAILLQYTAPIYVVLLSWPLLGERISTVDVLSVFGCFAGIVWFFLDQLSMSGLVGNLLALGSGMGLGLLPLLLRRAERDSPLLSAQEKELLPFMPTVVLLFGNVLAVLCGALPMVQTTIPSPVSWLWLLVLGVVQIALAYLFYAAAVRRLRPVECLMIATLEPILNPVWVALGTGELPSRAAFVGGFLILGSVVFHGIHTALRKTRGNKTP
ncbi:MAG TPA: DMT family transporter [Pseudomonadota bacterium]|nr:DMT family transporter [Pseudomonadota bacterium]